jgi:S-(hydroxymethyl)glutathione dehydrogenase/alcohol dehydrogenase
VRAAVLREVGEPLEVADVSLAPLAPNQVRVRIAASGVCHSDLSVQNGSIPLPPPVVLGHEGAGVVEETGAAVERVRPGDHVVLSWVPACRTCFYCLRGQPVLCERGLQEAFGAPYGSVDGAPVFPGLGTATFAEVSQVLERAVVPIDASIPLDVAALVGCAVTTGVGAVLNTARVQPGASVAVVGCGGVGLSVIEGAVLAGAASVTAIDKALERLALAGEVGATHVVDASSEDPVAAVREVTGGRGADYVFEVVGSGATIRTAFEATRRGGTTTLVGAGRPDDHVGFNAMEMFVDAKRILGCVYGSADPDRDFPKLLELDRVGRLDLGRLITSRIGLADLDEAFRAMKAGEGARSVVVFD